MTSICCGLEGVPFDVEQSAMTSGIDGRPVINDFMTHPQAADGGQLNGNDLRAAMKIVYEHMHRIQRPTATPSCGHSTPWRSGTRTRTGRSTSRDRTAVTICSNNDSGHKLIAHDAAAELPSVKR